MDPITKADDQPRDTLALAQSSSRRAPGGRTWQPLPHAAVEARNLAAQFRNARHEASAVELRGPHATEAAVRSSVAGRSIVHLATHGFVRTDLPSALEISKPTERPGLLRLAGGAERHLLGHDPMLLSGLALAGANSGRGGAGDDGILTALEAGELDLWGTDLVVLSACDTAGGSVQAGEGVLGLVRAFAQAGTRNVVASLWQVDDEAARLLMQAFYKRYLDGASSAGALQAAANRLRHHGAEASSDADRGTRERRTPRPGHRLDAPRHWAAFVSYGPVR